MAGGDAVTGVRGCEGGGQMTAPPAMRSKASLHSCCKCCTPETSIEMRRTAGRQQRCELTATSCLQNHGRTQLHVAGSYTPKPSEHAPGLREILLAAISCSASRTELVQLLVSSGRLVSCRTYAAHSSLCTAPSNDTDTHTSTARLQECNLLKPNSLVPAHIQKIDAGRRRRTPCGPVAGTGTDHRKL